jgi:hypothetical protein
MELVDAHLKVLYFTADFLWSHPFSPEFAIVYGGGAGLGVVWGPLYRVQSYPKNGGWDYCTGPNTPNPQYCAPDQTLGADPQHYPGYSEPSWAGGGSKPVIFPWLALQTGLRFKPAQHFVARLDLGIGFGHVFAGLGVDYGL